MLKNTDHQFGKVAIFIHWLSALIIIGQFSFGLYMLSLDYYDPNYRILPHYHKSIGILFAILLTFRLVWMKLNSRPGPASGASKKEHLIGLKIQKLMLWLTVIVVILGYLISTAKGDSIRVFNWFEVPATISNLGNQADWAAELHYWFAWLLIVTASLHGLAAIKHHFYDKDETLLRMLGKSKKTPKS